LTPLYRAPQRAARRGQARLPEDLVEAPRAQSIRQRSLRIMRRCGIVGYLGVEQVHGRSIGTTLLPALLSDT
jgi:hypothetical protein